ncbi:hypothetical protein VPNG_03098 [Cytospora leucostoma]|uniref:PWI domain-containing protein n=1 Tax=Cytospora leucostoma TaxID=1230097 RepID=A0A423XGI0_9PEZI|nr:hypothetical protein VPNG_03098 [Cytospora leucostoma]
MAYNPYGAPGNPYGPPPAFNPFPGAAGAPGMAPPPGLGPPPGMSSAPGMAPPPGVQHANSAAQANRPSGLPASFQPPPNLPNINFNAPVIRLGASSLPPKPAAASGPDRRDATPVSAGGNRPGLGADRNLEQSRAAVRESMQALQPPTQDERIRTLFLHKLPESLGGDEGVERFLSLVGRLRRWDSAKSYLSEHKGELFGFAQYDDPESLASAVELLKDVELPAKKQEPTEGPANDDFEEDESYKSIEKVKLQVAVDESTTKFLETFEESRADGSGKDPRIDSSRASLKQALRDLFYPPLRKTRDGDGDISMGGADASGENVEVINIPLAQEDELADIPAEMREVVAQEIAAFRERSNRRDMERLKREEEMEEMERRREGASRPSRDSPPPGANSIPLGPRGVPNAPSGPRGAGGRGVSFINGGANGDYSHNRDDDDTDASDDELYQRELAKQKAEDEKLYLEAERKWVNRERQRAAALERETDREKAEADSMNRRIEEQLEREKNWDDEKEASRKAHPYYRDHASWARKRAQDRAEEESRDDADRRTEEAERRREAAEMEQARDMADSFLNQQAAEMESRQQAEAVSAPARFTMSLGAAAQKAQQRAGPARRTMAEVEGLLDDEEAEQTTKRQLVPIKFDPLPADAKTMTEEEIQQAVKSLAQEIPATKEGLWAWDVKWDYLDEGIITDKLRPFIEKKVVEYLGVQEQLLVDVVEEHLRKHAKPSELADELEGPLEDDAEDLVKKLWRMVIFFTESEKRGLPA